MSLLKQRQQAILGQQKQPVPTHVVTEHKINPSPVTHSLESNFQHLAEAMQADVGQAKQIKDRAERRSFKAQALEQQGYLEQLETYRQSGERFNNPVLAWVFIWLADLGRWRDVIKWMPVLIEQKQALPNKFDRDNWQTFVIDEIYEAAKDEIESDKFDVLNPSEIQASLYQLEAWFNELEWEHHVHAIVAGKLFRIIGEYETAYMNKGRALKAHLRAQELNDGAGVKGHARKLAKELNVEIEF
ncbi:phage terminase small subunit [Pseudoalteromonas luteoviolacea]|uniref:Terminase n=1 Tax=Pseudoalteromonas luteoviolacea S4060-1 TaxID=1365257 RepID=A0A161YJS9_9GAMM|nr:phage terminase small subunit [Pseudoalteromonas luteoviolacea]KZN61550.1 hypothetical protein N478_05635 [Pseudoalteromonas luteoviolacea S4060-1]